MATLARPAIPVLSLVLLLAAAVLLNYIDRGTIAVAAPLMKAELELSATAFGLAVSAFFWVYAPIQLAVGWLCDRFSVYRLLAGGLALWALSTAMTGFVGGIGALVTLRLLLGLGESIAFPGCSKIICRHVPASRRGIANAAVAAAIALGPAVGTFAGGLLMVAFGWRAMFVIFGLATLLWLLPWHLTVRDIAHDAPAQASDRFPLGRLIGSRALWGLSLGHFCINYGFYFILAWLPLYLVQSRGYSIRDMTVLATLVYLVQAASALSTGWASDRMVAGGQDEGRVRRISIVGGCGLLGLAIIGIALADSQPVLIAFLLLAGVGCGPCSVNLFAIAQIFAGPKAAGTWVGVQNAIGNFAGIVGPIATGMIIDGTGSFMSAFVIAAIVCAAGVVALTVVMPRIEPVKLN